MSVTRDGAISDVDHDPDADHSRNLIDCSLSQRLPFSCVHNFLTRMYFRETNFLSDPRSLPMSLLRSAWWRNSVKQDEWTRRVKK